MAPSPNGNPVSTILLIVLTILIPPLGVFMVAGCGADLLINICLTVLGYFPGHIHAFYIEYVYFNRQDQTMPGGPAPGVYSDNVQNGGQNYGTV